MPEEIIDMLAAHGSLIAACLVGIALVALAIGAARRRRAIEACLTRLTDLQAMSSAYGQSLIAMDAAITRLERCITEFTEHNLEIQSQFAFNRAFEEASRMVRDGGTAESLVAACGLSDAEAALMVRLHSAGGSGPASFRSKSRVSPAAEVAVADAAATGDGHLTDEEIRLREVLKAAQRA